MTGNYVLTLHLLAEFESSKGTQTDSYGYLKLHGDLMMPVYSWGMEFKSHTLVPNKVINMRERLWKQRESIESLTWAQMKKAVTFIAKPPQALTNI